MQNNVHGNSATATKLATLRKIKVQGAVTGETSFDGSGDVTINTKTGTVVIGNIILQQNGTEVIEGQVEVSYPAGYNKSNCKVQSVGFKPQSESNYSYGIGVSTRALQKGAVSSYVQLNDSKILIAVSHKHIIATTQTLNYNFELTLLRTV